MNDFELLRPGSLAEAVAALREAPEAKLLAGGQSLLPMMKLDLAQPPTLVSLARVDELRGIRAERGSLRIGGGVTHAEVAASAEVVKAIPPLACLAGGIGDAQVRNRGTLGGSIAHADPAADYPAALLALGATVETDRREIDADAFFTGLFETALADDEIVVGVRFPTGMQACYAKLPNPASKFAVVGVMVARAGKDVRVAVTGAGPKVFRVAEMEQALAKRFEPAAIADIAVAADGLLGDADASAEYRAHMVGVMARRAVAQLA